MTDVTPLSGFAALGLSEASVNTLRELGYEAPTPIQERTIPLLLGGADVVGQAQTGTGKTAAFALPILEMIDASSPKTQALVLTPTRELAMQVAEAIHTYARGTGQVSVLPVYGGAPIVHQLRRLEKGVQVVVGTPGRLLDHLDRGTLKLDGIRMIVLDEADEMLRMGFIDDVEKILSSAPAERQIALFSATMPPEVQRIAQRHLRNPKRVEIEHRALTAPQIDQRFLILSEHQKLEVLTQLLELQPSEAVLIFRRTKNGAAELAEKLEARGFAAVAMHGDMTQVLREGVIRRLRAGQVEIVVATDVAARGLDVEQIEHVINYDIPNDVEAYVHRIGRTGRAGRSGTATLFVTPRERRMMREIEKFTGTGIQPMKMPTGADVAARRISLFKETLRKTIREGDLDLYHQLVQQLVDEGPHDIAEVAAAAARLASGSRSLSEPERQPVAAFPPPLSTSATAPVRRPTASRDFAPRDPARPPDRETRGPRSHDSEEPKVRLAMNLGKRDGVRPADIVGSIANEADIPGRDIGPIEIREDVTYVSVPVRHQERVISSLAKARFKGRNVEISIAGEGAAPSPDRVRPASPPRAPRESGYSKGAGYSKSSGDSKAGGSSREGRPSRTPAAAGSSGYSRERKPYAPGPRRRDDSEPPRSREGRGAPAGPRGKAPFRPGATRRSPSSGGSERGPSSERSSAPSKKPFYSGFSKRPSGKGPGKGPARGPKGPKGR